MSVETAVEASDDLNLLSELRKLFCNPDYIGVDKEIKAYLLPRTDAHQSEYLAEDNFHVEFISGFSGSSAFTIITDNEALLWTDGRYFSQAEKEFHKGWTLMKQGVPDAIDPIDWICQNIPSGSYVGFNPHLFSVAEAKTLLHKTANASIETVSIKQNLVDVLWTDRPIPPLKKIISLNTAECGEAVASKVERVRAEMCKYKCDTIVITLLDDVAWLLNIRGFDIPYNPVVVSVVILNFTDIFLFVDQSKMGPEIVQHLADVKIYPYQQAVDFLEQYHKQFREKCSTHRIWVPDTTNYALASTLDEECVVIKPSPIQAMKAVKNSVELSGMRNAGIRDSAAHVQFFLWLKREMELDHHVTEDRASKQMDYYRSQLSGFVSLSFESISAVGENAALAHYKHTKQSSRRLLKELPTNNNVEGAQKDNENDGAQQTPPEEDSLENVKPSSESLDTIYLIDSGGQYRDGTTDVTRTVYVGSGPADEHFRHMFTLVVKGHIELAMLIFPSGTSGIRLESLARHAMWRSGYNFEHGVGHGVGHFLNVHEYPPFIGHRVLEQATTGIQANMVYTIEPGYYEPGRFGIRIENSYETVPVPSEELASHATNFLRHVPLTWVPIQKHLIIVDLLEPKHVQWINAYHNKCLELVGKYLQERGLQEEYNYLAEACTPL